MTSPNVTIVTDETFEKEVLESDRPVLIDYFADWCGPCKAFAPTVDKFADAHPEIKVVKVNVDDSPNVSQNIRSIPTVVLVQSTGPQEASGIVLGQGVMTLKQLEEAVDKGIEFLKNPPNSMDKAPGAPKPPKGPTL